jgi:hypothetical protein
MSTTLRDAVLKANDLARFPVETPEWDGVNLFLRVMTGAEREAFEKQATRVMETKDVTGVRGKWLATTLVDENGERVFDPVKDVQLLGGKNSLVIERLYKRFLEVNKLTEESVKDDLGNSPKTQAEDSGSDSASPSESPQ